MHNRLSADPAAMILGILSILLSLTACCCSWLFFIPAIMSIIGLVLANKSIKMYAESPDNFIPSSIKNVQTAKVLNIIGVILSGLFFLVFLVRIIFLGSAISTSILDDFRNNNETFEDYDWNEEDVEDQDSIYQRTDTIQWQETIDEEIIEIEEEDIEETSILEEEE